VSFSFFSPLQAITKIERKTAQVNKQKKKLKILKKNFRKIATICIVLLNHFTFLFKICNKLF